MELTHEFTVPASIEETWAAFDDIESVAACFPGAQVTSVEGDTFQGTVKVKLGPIALVYNGTGTFVEKDESAHTMKIEAKGKDKRGNGTAGADVVATMTDEGGATKVSVHTDLAITGKPAQFGRGVIQDVSDKLLGQFTACLEQKVGGGGTAPEAAPAAETPQAASAAADAATGQAKAKQESAPPGPVTAAPPPPRPAPPQDDALDLGATVLPVLARTYWREATIVVLLLLLLLGRRRRG
ncbi:MAG: SRPBCC family protein [Marmoricola sp.]|nr:SRPBCC family protein [Marmoricola sp.]